MGARGLNEIKSVSLGLGSDPEQTPQLMGVAMTLLFEKNVEIFNRTNLPGQSLCDQGTLGSR